ncbi:DUF4998 domain-containing protein [Algibacter miyuki]|uniref:DUF4998 domain-containing protein n=1 Tax=Algibacter miyuki TaxID=1306933 RepID=A0ABV5H3C7_9FLAO|nr:DUF4998 domain-containing protein [Algibacter miyuki]MDN3665356.1 DUF4998 domain-containing protein [Algibacter miyuki]MDN3667636.1 DUF4998 domain-containing protein [Algibacter miyuki]
MKINNLIIIGLLLIFCFSCEEQDEIYKQYLTETVYPGKADSLRSYIGIEKVYLAWDAPTDAKAERMVIKYSATDSIISETVIDTIVVTGLNSGETYNFEVFSVDAKDNQSIKQYADLFPVSEDWVSKNMFIAKPQILPTDGVNVNSLTFSWAALDNDVMKYKDGLEFTMTDNQGNALVIDPANISNNVENGKLSIIVPNLEEERAYTITYKMLFSPQIDNKVILDTTPLSGEITFVPADYSLDPIFMLVESIGWDAASFVTLSALEPGRYFGENIYLKANDVIRAFHDKELTSEKQYGFSFFNTIADFMRTSDDGNDNIQLDINDGPYDIIVETTSKVVNITGPYNGPIEVPGIVEAEFFNIGGQGIAYNDADTANRGKGWRSEGVDVEGSLTGRSNLGYTSDGEWMIYTINVLETGTYQVDGMLSSSTGSGNSVGQLAVFIDDIEVTLIEVEGTGNWGTYKLQPANNNIQLEAGIHKLKLFMRSPKYNFDYTVFTKIN